MATWQADFRFFVATGLPADYRQRFATVLPPGNTWTPELEMWGTCESDRVDLFQEPGEAPEILCRIDLRDWKPELYARLIQCLRGIGGQLQTVGGQDVALDAGAFERALRSSNAARFVENPRAFFDWLRSNPVDSSE